MHVLPSREAVAALRRQAREVSPGLVTAGIASRRADGRLSAFYSYPEGTGEFDLPGDALSLTIGPPGAGPASVDGSVLAAHPDRAFESFQLQGNVQRLTATDVPGAPVPSRVWLGTADPAPFTDRQWLDLEALAASALTLLQADESEAAALARLRRLELAAGLVPALLDVLDVRDVFDRLSTTARAALPHDLLLLRLFSDDLSSLTVYATSERGTISEAVPNTYPAPMIRAWSFDIVEDLTEHPYEATQPPAKMGARSSLRLPIRIGDHVVGGLAVLSFVPAAFSTADVPVARRLAEHVAVGLSHYRLAEQGREAATLRARAASLQLLDGLLGTLTDVLDLRDVFERVSTVARSVLPHDAAALMVRMPRNRARRFAAVGLPSDLPEESEIPPEILANPEWDHAILDDLSTRTSDASKQLAEAGYRSMLQVSLRHDERFAGALLFYSTRSRAFAEADVPIARRIADRMAVALARNRELDAERRADEATERAARLEARVRALTDELDARTGYRRVIGESKEWRQVLTQATQVAATDTTALLLGESGTGKEVVARFIHRASKRSHGPFVALNCAALPEQLLEAELFGYERGAFTGAVQSKPGQLEQAAGGTLFLDEVGEMSPGAQAKFLRVLQEREFQRLGGTRVLRSDARIVAATNRDLPRAIAQGHFREDLYYRLHVFAIRLPALRERPADVLPLSEAFLADIGKGLGRPPGGVARDARERLLAYRWPGNVRELHNVLERAAILSEGGLITADLLGLDLATAVPRAPAPTAVEPAPAPTPPEPPAPLAAPASAAAGDLASLEKAMVEQALAAARFNKSKAAAALGLTRHQLYIRMRRHGLE